MIAAVRSNLWKVLLLAFVAMCLQDIMGTVMVIFEAQAGANSSNVWADALLAGLFDVGGWITGLICAALAIDSIIREGWRTHRSLSIIAVVSLANLVGTFAGVFIAIGITPHH